MKKIIMAIASVSLLCTCGTIFSSGKQELAFDSNIADTEIYINGQKICSTPCITNIERGNKKLLIKASKTGYTDRTLFIDPGYNPMSMGNFLSMGTSTFGFTTDATDDHLWQYAPNSFYITLYRQPHNESERKIYEKADHIRDFILKNFDRLQTEVYEDGKPEYIKTTASMSGISESEIKEIIVQSYSESECAERIVGTYIRKQGK